MEIRHPTAGHHRNPVNPTTPRLSKPCEEFCGRFTKKYSPKSAPGSIHNGLNLSILPCNRIFGHYAVRRRLRNTKNPKLTVAEVARSYGFGHLGHFARDYRNLFGEYPSDTLPKRGDAGGL
jgi:AraC-like DNA-binding protein